MAITYDELLRRVPIWLYAVNRALVAEMPALIEAAEEQLMLVVDHDLFRTTITGMSITGASPTLDLSGEDILELRSISLQPLPDGDFVPLERRDADAMRMLFPGAAPGTPRFYAEDAEPQEYAFFPTPDATYPLRIHANVRPARLAPGQQTNIMTEQIPRAVEKAVLRQAALFMKNQVDADRYEGEMTQALVEAGAHIGRRRRDNTGTKARDTTNVTGT